MKKIVMLFLCAGLLVLGCSQKVTKPVSESELSFVILDCAEAKELFNTEGDTTLPAAYYAWTCSDRSTAFVDICFRLPVDSRVSLVIKNATGYEIRTLVNEILTAGYKKVTWDGRTDKGSLVESGIYIASLRAGEYKAELFMVGKY